MSDLMLSLWAAPAAVGFAVFFNVRRRTLIPIASLAVLAHALRTLFQEQGVNVVAASFVAAFVIGVAAYTLGPATGEASPVYGFAPVIPLIPGSLLFDGLASLAELVNGPAAGVEASAVLTVAATRLFTAAGVVLALALGATAPMLLLPRMRTVAD